MKRYVLDVVVVLSMASLPFAVGAGYEAKRMLILAAVYGAVALLGGRRLISAKVRQTLDLTVAGILLALSWLESFPAWNHSTHIGLYLLFGTAVLVIALLPRREPVDRDAQRIRAAHQAMLAVWNLSR